MLPVAVGDMIYVDAGTVHAIWPGSILLETQQYSDVTYRMYDYGRPRELHIEKSLEATKLRNARGKSCPARACGPHRADRCGVLSHGADSRESASRTSESLRGAGGKRGLAYLFAAAGAGRLSAAGSSGRNLTQSICRRAESWRCRRPRRSLCWKKLSGTGDRLESDPHYAKLAGDDCVNPQTTPGSKGLNFA